VIPCLSQDAPMAWNCSSLS